MKMKVHFQGRNLWWLKEDNSPCGPLAPIEHCDDTGEIIDAAVAGESFAHVYEDGHISRHGALIGTVEDLQMGWS